LLRNIITALPLALPAARWAEVVRRQGIRAE
jgi:hypothetical protein